MRWESAAALGLCAWMTGCAAIVTGVNQPISVETRAQREPLPGAACKLSSNKGEWFVTTPASVVVHRGYQNLLVECAKDGFAPAIASIASSTKAMAFGNILFGGAIGVGVDVGTGAAYDYPALITVEMGRAGPAAIAPSATAPASASPYDAPTPVPLAPVAGREQRYRVSAESYARERSCATDPRAVLVAYGPSSETYMMSCTGGPTLVARCDAGTCRELK